MSLWRQTWKQEKTWRPCKRKFPEQREQFHSSSFQHWHQPRKGSHALYLFETFLLKAIHKMPKAILSKYPDEILTKKKLRGENGSINRCDDWSRRHRNDFDYSFYNNSPCYETRSSSWIKAGCGMAGLKPQHLGNWGIACSRPAWVAYRVKLKN